MTGSVTMRLVIFGSTGGTGRRLVERAIAEGHEVTAFVRDSSRMTARHQRLKIVVGDAFDPGPVREAVAGNEAVISVLGSREPSNPLHPRRPGDPNGVASAGSANIVAAMKEYGLRRFVCQTACGVGESDLQWTIVRPMILTNGPWTNDYRAGEDLKPGRRPYISRADAADFLIRQLTEDTFVHNTPAIGY